MAEEFHDNWEVVPFNLNMKPMEDPDARALVPKLCHYASAAPPNPTMLNQFSPHHHNPYFSRIIIQEGDHHQGANRHEDPSTQTQ